MKCSVRGWGQAMASGNSSPPSSSSSSSVVWVGTGFEVKDAAKPETPNSLPAPPQMPLPEIPQPWLVSPTIARSPGRLGYFWSQGQMTKTQFWKKGGLVLPKALLGVWLGAASNRWVGGYDHSLHCELVFLCWSQRSMEMCF